MTTETGVKMGSADEYFVRMLESYIDARVQCGLTYDSALLIGEEINEFMLMTGYIGDVAYHDAEQMLNEMKNYDTIGE